MHTKLGRGQVVDNLFDGLDGPVPTEGIEVSIFFCQGKLRREEVSGEAYILKFPPTKNLRPILAVEWDIFLKLTREGEKLLEELRK